MLFLLIISAISAQLFLDSSADMTKCTSLRLQEVLRWNEKARTNPLQLHPYLQVQERTTSYRQGGSNAPNLAAFTVAAAAAGMVTALLFETKVVS